MNIEPTGPYVYQPYAVATKHGAAGRLWAVSGLSALHPLASGELRGLTKEEAQRVVAALTASPVAPKAGAGETEDVASRFLRHQPEPSGEYRFRLTPAEYDELAFIVAAATVRPVSRTVPTAPVATEVTCDVCNHAEERWPYCGRGDCPHYRAPAAEQEEA